jgi:hypothetical protein
MIMDRKPASSVRSGVEGGFWAAAAVVASQVAASYFPGVDGVGLMAAAGVGAFGAWLSSVSRSLAANSTSPVVKALLGVQE